MARRNDNIDLERRKYVLAGIAFTVIFIYIIQLFYLQVIKNEYKSYADNNAFFNNIIYPARGTISDRNGKLLVYNQPTYSLVYIPREVQSFDTLDFCRILGITKKDFDARIAAIKDRRLNPGYSTYTIQTFAPQLDIQESLLIQEKLYKFPGFFVQNRTIRQYTYPNAGAILGYVAEVNEKQIGEDKYYSPGDYAGKSGIELSYEKYLRGKKGVEILLRDAKGRIQGRYEDGIHDEAPISGNNLKLSIDMDLQAYGEYLMQNKIGAIVMIEPSTGELLCMVTSPSYDPSMLLGRSFGKNYLELEGNPLKPLFNRAIQGVYPPGSTFKPTQGLIFLQEQIINKNTSYPCVGGYPPLGGRPKCHIHGAPLPLEPALSTSCNSFFCYGLTAMLNNRKYGGINEAFDVWKDHLVNMGFGYPLGVDLPYEKRGLIPNSKFYTSLKGKNWKAGNVISIAIGQGEVLITPLQGANLAATIANRGYFYTPHLVKEIQDTILDKRYTDRRETGIKKEHYDLVANGMMWAVAGGTCRAANLSPDFVVCGKTGTAENPHGNDHSMFMGFAPMNDPKVAIFVIVENGGFGATTAVPIARLMLQMYLKGELRYSDLGYETMIANMVNLPSEYYTWLRGTGKTISYMSLPKRNADHINIAKDTLNSNILRRSGNE